MTTRKPATRVPVVRDGRTTFDEVITEEPLHRASRQVAATWP